MRIRNYCSIITIIACLFICRTALSYSESSVDDYELESITFQQVVPNQTHSFQANATVDFASRYVWRGLPVSQYAVFEPAATISKWGFTPNFWGNMNMGNEQYQGKFNEVDLGINYLKKFGNFAIKPAYTHYFYPSIGDEPSSGEASISFSYVFLNCLELFSNNYFDVVDQLGAYYGNAGLGYMHRFKKTYIFQTAVSGGWANAKWNDYYVGANTAAGNHVTLDMSLFIKMKSWFFVRPYLQANFLTDPALRNSPYISDPNPFVVALSVGVLY